MGNTASSNVRTAGLDSLVGELGSDVEYERSMGDSRFLKTFKARHTHGPLVVKTFFKPRNHDAQAAAVATATTATARQSPPQGSKAPSEGQEEQASSTAALGGISLADLVRKLRKERESLATAPNVLTYQTVVETENAGYLIRQWLASSLYDRISTRPFLSPIEKLWLTFQLLMGMRTARARGVPHGDLKTENILVTSSLMLYISDFAGSIKPTYLPLDDPDDFGVFFDTSGRRVCYLAPERFFDASSRIAAGRSDPKPAASAASAAAPGLGFATSGNRLATMSDPFSNILGMRQTAREGSVTEQMDIFGAGCVIAELWRDGSPTFTLSQLFAYRRGQFDIEQVISGISNEYVQSMVRTMLSIEPDERGSFTTLLDEQRGLAFPAVFYDLVYPYLVALQRAKTVPSRDAKASLVEALGVASRETASSSRAVESRSEVARGEADLLDAFSTSSLRSEADDRLDRLCEEWPALFEQLYPGDKIEHDQADPPVDPSLREQSERSFPVALHLPGVASDVLAQPSSTPNEDGESILVLSVILSNLRNATRPSTKSRALEMCLHLAKFLLTDLAKLDRLLPYVVALFNDPSAAVRGAACRASTQLLLLVSQLPPSNRSVWTEYIVPQFQRLRSDPSILVRSSYAACIGTIVQTAKAHMDILRTSEGGTESLRQEELDLEECLQVEVAALLQDESNTVKRTLLADADKLCRCFGAVITNDILLSHMTTYLNNRDWRLRHSFFDAVIHIATVAGGDSLDSYVLPFVMEALNDPQEAVVLRVLQCLRTLVFSGTLKSTAKLYEIIGAVACFICHPNIWLRYAGTSLLAHCSARLGDTERWALVYPHVRPLLRGDAKSLGEIDLLSAALNRSREPSTMVHPIGPLKANTASFGRRSNAAKEARPSMRSSNFVECRFCSVRGQAWSFWSLAQKSTSENMTFGAGRSWLIRLCSSSPLASLAETTRSWTNCGDTE